MRDPEDATTLCRFCPKLCRHACPVADAEQSERATPWGKMTAMKMVEENKLPMDRETMGLAYKCLNCRASEKACELGNPVSQTLDTFRVRAFRAGLTPDGVEEHCDRFRRHNNPYDKDLLKILERKFPNQTKSRPPGGLFGGLRTAYFPGCTEIVKSPSTIAKTLSLLEGVSLYAEPIQCCGYPLFAAGDWEGFVELAEVNSHSLRDYDRILTGAPACLYTMETLYRSAGHGVGTQFQHVVEYLAAALGSAAPLRGRKKGGPGRLKVAYHDPCYLGRYRKIYQEPRALIRQKNGEPPIEFLRHGEDSACCGAGGLLPVSFPETAAKVTESRVEEFKRTGADLLVTSCPTCVQRFRKFGVAAQSLVDFLTDTEPGNDLSK